MPLDIDDVIARAHLPERTVVICLRGDLQAQWEDLDRQLTSEQENADDESLAGNPRIRELADQMEAVGKEIGACSVVFRFRGLGAKAYSDLLVKNKATEDDAQAVDGLNFATYPTALIAACAVDPVMTEQKAGELSEKLSAKQWDDLFAAALAVNTSAISVPFSLSASAIRARIEPSSKQPEPGASAGQSSLDESLFEPQPTSTTKTPAG
jgi:hypothetical protein